MIAEKLMLFPATTVDRRQRSGLRLRSGWGRFRGRHELPESDGARLAQYLLSLQSATARDVILKGLRASADLTEQDASELLEYLEAERILVSGHHAAAASTLIGRWAERGWRQAALHTVGGFGVPFEPDSDGGAQYEAVYERMLADTSVPAQPPAVKGQPLKSLARVAAPADEPLDATFEEVLNRAIQIYAYEPHQLDLGAVHQIVHATFRNQRTIPSGLGDALLRSYPSGGARHPLEAYVVARGDDTSEAGTYYYDPDTGDLILISRDAEAGAKLDQACFMKRGVRSSNYSIVISVRWLRHMWKYRYARSYRMVLLEVGHAIQSASFAALARGVQAYYCPSYNDSVVNELCLLGDPYEESAAIVLSLGRNGLTVEQYRKAYETNA